MGVFWAFDSPSPRMGSSINETSKRHTQTRKHIKRDRSLKKPKREEFKSINKLNDAIFAFQRFSMYCNAETLVRRAEIANDHSIAYSLGNLSAKITEIGRCALKL